MITLKEIIDNESINKMYDVCLEQVDESLKKRSSLYNINSPLDLDKNLEFMHSAKMNIDNCIKIIEFKKIELTLLYQQEKEQLKISTFSSEISYDELRKQQKEDLTKVDFEKRRFISISKLLKEETDSLNLLDEKISILKFEFDSLIRLRENIDDIYLSLKKKYESLLKLKV